MIEHKEQLSLTLSENPHQFLGGVIGQLLFIMYVNDIASEIESNSNIKLFVDDTKIFSESNFVLQKSLDKINYCLKKKEIEPKSHKCHVLNI